MNKLKNNYNFPLKPVNHYFNLYYIPYFKRNKFDIEIKFK